MDFKLPYGLKNDKLVTINDVLRGLACDCFCPACKVKLIAKKGAKMAHHFAHYKSADCKHGLETAIHLLAKDIIARSKTFTLPSLNLPNTDFEIFAETEIMIDSVKLETRFHSLVPDIILKTQERQLIVEIAVTHYVDSFKMIKIKKNNVAAIEINMRYLMHKLFTGQHYGLEGKFFTEALINGTNGKRWIFNPKLEKIEKHLKDNYADVKIIKVINFKDSMPLNYVDDCPLEVKSWKGGKNKGKSFASIEDCKSCKFCLEIESMSVPHKYLIDFERSFPKKVFCLGNYRYDIEDLLKEIK